MSASAATSTGSATTISGLSAVGSAAATDRLFYRNLQRLQPSLQPIKGKQYTDVSSHRPPLLAAATLSACVRALYALRVCVHCVCACIVCTYHGNNYCAWIIMEGTTSSSQWVSLFSVWRYYIQSCCILCIVIPTVLELQGPVGQIVQVDKDRSVIGVERNRVKP